MRVSSSSNLAWSRHLVVAVGVTLLGAVWAYTAWSILDLRGRASDVVRRQAEGLLEISGRAIAREIEIYDFSIRTVSERLNTPILEETNPELRHLALFDRVSTASGYGAIFVLNDRGQSYLDSRSLVPRRLDGSDRLYFTVHRDNPDAGLFIGRPWTARISGLTMVPMSRRLAYADGAFAGVVVGAIELDYFRKMVDRFRGKTALTVALDFTDGTVVVSNPDLAPHAEMSLEPDASGFQTSAQVGDLPLRVIVSVPAETIRAAWMPRLPPILAIAFALSLAIPAVLLVLKRELTRRVTAEERAVAAQAESERLAATDALTGLWNRRRFESALELWVKPGERQGWALLIVDTDYFKGYNDFYGHSAGDRALQRIAAILADRAASHGGSAYRIGGEEFAVLVPCTDAEVLVFAEGIRKAVAEMAMPHAQHPKGVLTVSGGLAHGGHMPNVASRAWFNAADEALYAAKRQGRDRICLAAANHTSGAPWAPLPLRAASA